MAVLFFSEAHTMQNLCRGLASEWSGWGELDKLRPIQRRAADLLSIHAQPRARRWQISVCVRGGAAWRALTDCAFASLSLSTTSLFAAFIPDGRRRVFRGPAGGAAALRGSRANDLNRIRFAPLFPRHSTHRFFAWKFEKHAALSVGLLANYHCTLATTG